MKCAESFACAPPQVLNTSGGKVRNGRLRQLRVLADLGLRHADRNKVRYEFLPVHAAQYRLAYVPCQ